MDLKFYYTMLAFELLIGLWLLSYGILTENNKVIVSGFMLCIVVVLMILLYKPI